MTLAELNGHLDLVQQLQKTEELIQGLWDAAVPGAQKLDGMPHASGVSDKVGILGAEIADMETQRDELKEQIAKSEETVAVSDRRRAQYRGFCADGMLSLLMRSKVVLRGCKSFVAFRLTI